MEIKLFDNLKSVLRDNRDEMVQEEGPYDDLPYDDDGGYDDEGGFIDEENGWTAYTIDGKDSAQWEHMILVTEDGFEILTY